MAKPKPVNQVSTKTLRGDLRAIRKRVQFQGESIPVYNYGDLVAGIVPVAIADQLELPKSPICQSSEIRQKLTHYCNLLQSGVLEVVWINVRDERAIALVSARVWQSMPPVELQPIREYQTS
ncbi:MAG: hypothetical protein KME11_04860 [Timaviella obliquedivisa GSE-PSE-MK23-08B]|nr:hypothetical protein [Timaviella obliquedivisa GSE-PSE-MK23-08B]